MTEMSAQGVSQYGVEERRAGLQQLPQGNISRPPSAGQPKTPVSWQHPIGIPSSTTNAWTDNKVQV